MHGHTNHASVHYITQPSVLPAQCFLPLDAGLGDNHWGFSQRQWQDNTMLPLHPALPPQHVWSVTQNNERAGTHQGDNRGATPTDKKPTCRAALQPWQPLLKCSDYNNNSRANLSILLLIKWTHLAGPKGRPLKGNVVSPPSPHHGHRENSKESPTECRLHQHIASAIMTAANMMKPLYWISQPHLLKLWATMVLPLGCSQPTADWSGNAQHWLY